MDAPVCLFCATEGVVLANERALARGDAKPVTPGQRLVTAPRHVADVCETGGDQRRAMLERLRQSGHGPGSEHQPDGFNVRVPIGQAAGRVSVHLHLHFMAQDRCGVRGVTPDKQSS